jgi:LPS-assembly protein
VLPAAWGADAGPSPPAVALQPSPRLSPLRADGERVLPIVLRARRISSQPDLSTEAEGEVEFRRGGLVIRSDRLSHDVPLDTARAQGQVRIEYGDAVYSGPLLELQVQRFEGFFVQPEFDLLALGARGSAARIEFIDSSRSRALGARYTGCPRVDEAAGEEPDWELRARRVDIDLERREGVAEGAELRFLGTRVIALPTLSFPLGDARRSGWLPPSLNIDNRSGVELAVPYYWNIAPQRDATFTPRLITRRGLGLDGEFRVLGESHQGSLAVEGLPHDRLADRSRHALFWTHEAQPMGALRLQAQWQRVSDDDWWKDFPTASRSLTPRLLPLLLSAEHALAFGAAQGQWYARVQHWQVLQGSDDRVDAPYQRAPQLGLALHGTLGAAAGWQWSMQTEFNRFTLPHGQARAGATGPGRPTGDRWHLLAEVSRPWREPGWWMVPRLSVNAAHYRTERDGLPGVERAQRTVPTFSLDAGLTLERPLQALGRTLVQTLEPRVLYVYTPFREQAGLPSYDATAKDFNFTSLFTENSFSGIDRVADLHQITGGVTTRLVDAASGAEALRLGWVQRVLLRPQRVAPQADGSPDGPALTQRLSDALLLGSTSVIPHWTLDAALQYSPELGRGVRNIAAARWQPDATRTLAVTYRLARGLNEQVELGWQWPLAGPAARAAAPGGDPLQGLRQLGTAEGCRGSWYLLGRANYSLSDRRVTDSVMGVEYDAGCWLVRAVAERLSTGRGEATTRLMLQLELVGLSRVGSSPLRASRGS